MKSKKLIKIASLLLAALMLFSGCGKNTESTNASLDFKKTLADGYPVKDCDKTITWWIDANPSMYSTAGNLGDTPFGKLLMEKTGVKIKFIHPPQGQTVEQFNLMVASGEYPDIVTISWQNYYPGGADAAIDEDIILPLNEILEKGGAPNLKKYYDENPDVAAQLKTDDGHYFAFPMLASDNIMGVYTGAMIRKDLLDKAGLEVPETIEELDVALRAFKAQGIKVPLLLNPYVSYQDVVNGIVSGYGIGNGLYVDGKKVKFGPLEPEYKEYIAQMHEWYEEGILDAEFATENNKRRDSLFVSGDIGLTWGSCGSVFGRLIPILEEENPNAEYVPIILTHKKGAKPEFGHQENITDGLSAITTSCKDVELAAKLLDYAYSEEGYYTWNFGEEGVSYEMKDGVPTYTDVITNPDKNGGLSMVEALAKYTSAAHSSSSFRSKDYLMQYYSMDVQQKALELWADTNAMSHILPVLYPTVEESRELSTIKTEIDTYREEMLYKFITGTEPMSKYDEYIKVLKSMKVDRMIEIQQNVYNRYLDKIAK